MYANTGSTVEAPLVDPGTIAGRLSIVIAVSELLVVSSMSLEYTRKYQGMRGRLGLVAAVEYAGATRELGILCIV